MLICFSCRLLSAVLSMASVPAVALVYGPAYIVTVVSCAHYALCVVHVFSGLLTVLCVLLTELCVYRCVGASATFPAALLPVLNALRVASPLLRLIISFADLAAMEADPFLVADATSVTLQPMEMQVPPLRRSRCSNSCTR